MGARFADPNLDRLETDKAYTGRYPQAIIRAYRKAMAVIRSADSEAVFYGLKGMHFEKLKGRPGQHSIRLNRQFRLILEFEGDNPKVAVIVGITDHYK